MERPADAWRCLGCNLSHSDPTDGQSVERLPNGRETTFPDPTAVTPTRVYAVTAANEPLVLTDVEIDAPEANEVLVEIVASGEAIILAQPSLTQRCNITEIVCWPGICHSDLNLADGSSPFAFPVVLGHEGAGIVREVGSRVTLVKPGDKVLTCWTYCDTCEECSFGRQALCVNWLRYNFMGNRVNGEKTWSSPKDGKPDASGLKYGNFMSQGSFAKHILIDKTGVVKLKPDADLIRLAAGVSCGIMTGAGTVFNSFRNTKLGASIAIFGVGAVGAAAILASRCSTYTKIIAIDLYENRLAIARKLGATHTINGKAEDVVSQIIALTNGGVDFAIEATGVPAVLQKAYDSLRKGGTVGIVGVPPVKDDFTIATKRHLISGKRLVGVSLGDATPQTFIPFLVDLEAQGRLPIWEAGLAKAFKAEQINEAIACMRNGSVIKPVIVW